MSAPDTTEPALGGNVPALDLEDPAQLEALYGSFAFFDHWRKSVLSQCREIVRAQHTDVKITEARIDDLARNHKVYLDFLAEHFVGREKMEQNRWDSLAHGA